MYFFFCPVCSVHTRLFQVLVMRKIILFFLVLFSTGVIADNYNATSTPGYNISGYLVRSTAQLACNDVGTYYALEKNGIMSCWTQNSTAYPSTNIYGVNKSTVYSCPYSGTVSGSSCINATPCLNGRDSITGACLSITCPAGQYDNAGICAAIPDCNASNPNGGDFFNLTTKQCETYIGELTICIAGDSTGYNSGQNKYCPPIDDCKPDGYICTNSPTAISAATQARQQLVEAAKTAANENKAKATAAAQQAKEAAAKLGLNLPAAVHAADAAKIAMDNVKANPASTEDQIKLAEAIYNQAVRDANSIQARANNAANAAASAATKGASVASDAADAINTAPGGTNPGNSGALEGQSIQGLQFALNGLNDAITGLGSGDGQQQGISKGTCEVIGNCDNGTTASSPGAGSGKGRFYTSTGKTVQTVGADFITKATNSPLLKAGGDIFAVQFPQVNGCANCDMSLTLWWGESIAANPFCAQFMDGIWLFVAAALKVATVLMAFRLMITPTF